MLDTMCSLCFKSGVPYARQAYTHQEVPNDSLILYLPVILGKLLPANILSGLLNTLKSKRFYTSHGFATESLLMAYIIPAKKSLRLKPHLVLWKWSLRMDFPKTLTH